MAETPIKIAAQLIESADRLLITAGAGMGVDSGLPDFRGNEGFWKAYPALSAAQIDFTSIANPHAFERDPRLAWGFYGHRLALYRRTVPHEGFAILRQIADRMPVGAFVVTSNVDGQFQKAGFAENRVLEIHGSIHRLQCLEPCSQFVWPADLLEPVVDDARCQWLAELPTCARCGALSRPNILMFDDWAWVDEPSEVQRASWDAWSAQGGTQVVIELGAGVDVPSIRRLSANQRCPVIRINPRHVGAGDGAVILAMGAKDGLQAIWDAITRDRAARSRAVPRVPKRSA